MTKEYDCYVDASPRERVSFVWQLTAELWSLKDKQNVEQRLQSSLSYYFDMFPEMLIIGFGEIISEVDAPAFLPLLR